MLANAARMRECGRDGKPRISQSKWPPRRLPNLLAMAYSVAVRFCYRPGPALPRGRPGVFSSSSRFALPQEGVDCPRPNKSARANFDCL